MVHKIHIPVMGICYTVDTPIRVAHFGITSVISLVDDGLLEEYRIAYGERLGVDVGSPQTTRIGRIRSYLDFMADEVVRKFEWICGMRVAGQNNPTDKDRYFLMLPADSPLRAEYEAVCAKSGLARVAAEVALTEKMEVGEIQANIMVSLNHEEAALDAVRGFAASKVCGSLVLSAGVNLGVFEEIAKHECFYRKDASATSSAHESSTAHATCSAPQKKIILKVSDFRSAMIQSRYLAKKGLQVYEFRIESGVNCGGHAFLEAKKLMPDVLREFVEHKEELFKISGPARITAQGGLCTAQEIEDVLALGADGVGVGTPFLLVPQTTSADAETRALLAAATPADVKLTHASPLGVPFMNLCTSTAAEVCRRKTETFFENRSILLQSATATNALSSEMAPGFPCRQHYLARTLPGFDHPVCMASREYVLHRLAEIDRLEAEEIAAGVQPNTAVVAQPNAADSAQSADVTTASSIAIHEKFDNLRREALSRECICRFLGNAGREELRGKSPTPNYEREKVAIIRGAKTARIKEPVTVCPGPNIAYFNRDYTLLEMMQHLYGTGPSLTSADKPHAFDVEKQIFQEIAQS